MLKFKKLPINAGINKLMNSAEGYCQYAYQVFLL